MPKDATKKTKSAPKKRKYSWLINSLLVVFFIGTFLYWQGQNNQVDCTAEYRQDTIILTPNKKQLAVEIASDPISQNTGLSGRECIADDWGMLFSFKSSGQYDFWMKDMNFAIDIVWIDENAKVINVDKNVKPESYPDTFTSESPAKYVLEVGANQADSLGLTPGSSLTF